MLQLWPEKNEFKTQLQLVALESNLFMRERGDLVLGKKKEGRLRDPLSLHYSIQS